LNQLQHEHRPTLKGAELAALIRRSRLNQAQLREGFLGRAARVEEESAEVWHGPSAATLRNVRYNGQGRPNQLISPSERARAAKRLGELSALLRHAMRHLGHK